MTMFRMVLRRGGLATLAMLAGLLSACAPVLEPSQRIVVPDAALDSLARITSMGGPVLPQDVRDLAEAAIAKVEEADFAEAVVLLDRAVLRAPDSALLHFMRGQVHVGLEDWTKGFADYERALTLNPDYTDVYQRRGAAYHQRGDYRAALADYQRAIDLDPGNPWQANQAAWLLATATDRSLRDGARALALAEQAVALSPQAGYIDTRAAALVELGRVDEAVQTYLQASAADAEYAKLMEEELAKLPCSRSLAQAQASAWQTAALRACAAQSQALFTDEDADAGTAAQSIIADG